MRLLLGGAVAAGLAWWWSTREEEGGASSSSSSTSSASSGSVDLSRPTSTSLEDLDPDFREVLEHVIDDMEAQGYPVYVYETYRAAERQAHLHAQGYSQIESGGSHELGLGADLVDGRRDSLGRLILWGDSEEDWPNADEREAMGSDFFQVLGVTAMAWGLEWGGSWASFPDPAHVQSPSYS